MKSRGKSHDEEGDYMRRIRARAEMEPDSDEYDDSEEGEGAEEEEQQFEEEKEASASGSGSEGEEEDGFAPGRGYDTEEENDGSSGSESSSDDDEAAQAKREALAAVRSLPLAERLALMASGAMHDDGAMSSRRRRRGQLQPGAMDKKKMDGDKGEGAAAAVVAKPKNKHAPTEVSSKKPVPRFRPVLPGAAPTGSGKRRKARDPRFDPALGKVNYDAFRQAYNFLEDYQEKELAALQTAMKKAKSQGKKAELKAAMNAIRQEKSERQRADRSRELLRKAKREERGKVAAGKTPFFLKKREKRRLELEDRYEQLAKEGRLEKALAKKRRRNAAKDHVWLPRSRRSAVSVGGAAGGAGGGEDEGRGWM